MNSLATTTRTMMTNATDLVGSAEQGRPAGDRADASTTSWPAPPRDRWSPAQILEEIARLEEIDRTRRSLQSRLQRARIGRFKPMADFDWNWPKKIERDLIERALGLDFIREGRNLALIGTNGLGKTMIARNIAHQAVLAGFSVLCTTAAELIEDLRSCGPETLRRRLGRYTRPHSAHDRRGRLPRLRLARRRPALQGRRPPLRAARCTRASQPLHPDHHEPRIRRLEHRLPQRHLDRHPPRQAHPPRRRHADRRARATASTRASKEAAARRKKKP